MPRFSAILGDHVSGWGSGNEAALAAIRGQEEGRTDWRRAGRDFSRIFRKSWANRWELTVPDYWALIAAKNASFWRFKATLDRVVNGPAK